MTLMKGSLSFSLGIVLMLSLVHISKGNSLGISSCPMDIETTRSDLVYWNSPTVSTASSNGFTLTRDHLPGRYYYKNTTVTYTARDIAETVTCTFDIIVIDNGSPVIVSCPNDTTATLPFGQTQVSVTWIAPELESDVDVQKSSTKNSGDLFDIGRNIVKYTFKNTANESFCTFDVFVNEPEVSTVPTITCPADVPITLPLGVQSMAVTWDDPIYPINLGSVTLVCGRTKGDQFFEGINTVTCVAYFESNEAKMCSFAIDVSVTPDNEKPSILNCPANINQYVARGDTGATVTWPELTITDNSMQDLNLVGTHTNGDFYNLGTYDVVYTGTDVAGNFVTCSFQVIVKVDDLAPTFTNCPAEPLVFYVRTGVPNKIVSWIDPVASDNSGPVLTFEQTGVANGATVMAGNPPQAVSYTATDIFGNTQICAFTVEVIVDQAPTYIGCSSTDLPDRTVNAEPDVNYANVTWTEPSSTDDLSVNSLELTKSNEPGQDLPIGSHVILYTATDAVGNIGMCTFVITVQDQQKPVLGACPDSKTYTLGQSDTFVEVTWTNPSAIDNSGVVPEVTSDRSPGAYPTGVFTVEVTATDKAMNKDNCSFDITVNAYVRDTQKPTWSICPSSMALNMDSGLPTATHTWSIPTGSDDRGIMATFISNTPPFAFPVGANIVEYRATDAAGNVGVCNFTITVSDNQPPVWTSNTGCGRTIIRYVLPSRTTDLEVLLVNPVATDNSGIAPTITKIQSVNQNTPNVFPVGDTQITYTATDGASNSISSCAVIVTVTRATSLWSPRGSVTFTRIRGVTGQFSDAVSTQLLIELSSDMDKLFRDSSVGAQFAGITILSHTFLGGNAVVNFQLHFTKNGRHTSINIVNAFISAISGTSPLQFATNNVVVSDTFKLDVREFKVTTRLVGLDGPTTDPIFTSGYNDPTSAVYIALVNRINTEIDKAFTGNFAYLVSVVVVMRPGSVIQDTIIVFDGTSSTTEAQIVGLFNGQLTTNGELGVASGLYFDQVLDMSNQELCPSMECLNSGTCSVDDTYTNVCTCLDGYTGNNCETVPVVDVLSPLAIAGIIGGGVLLLILLFALFCCCMYFLREPMKPLEQYPMERPFHILDDEASVASSMDVFMLPRQRERSYLPALPPPPPPVLHLEKDPYPSDGPSFSPDGEVYVTGPNQVAIRPSSKRYNFY